jgi:hypothetical protein
VPYNETLEFEKKHEMMRQYFPCVKFSDFLDPDKSSDDIYLDLDYEILEKYIDRDKEKIYKKYYLDIPKMAGNEIFAPLFPSSAYEKTINKKCKSITTNKLKKRLRDELERIHNSGERPDIIKFFISKESEEFVKKLNPLLDTGFKIDEKYLGENFSNEHLINKIWCDYVSKETKSKTKHKGIVYKFVWDLSDINDSGLNFFHNGTIYRFFSCYAHKKCTLYLLGADFIEFLEDLAKCLQISKTCQDKINFSDFIWKKDKNWAEAESKKHLLEKLELNVNLKVDLKNIYHSFCVPLLDNKNYSKQSNKDKLIECGYDIIKSTFLKLNDIDKTDATKEKINYFNISADELIKRFTKDWEEIINYILEGTPEVEDSTEDIKGTKNIYCPTPFGRLVKQIAKNGESYFIKIWRAKKAQKNNMYINKYTGEEIPTDKGVLDPNDRQNISSYYREAISLVPKEKREELYKIKKSHERLKKICELMSLYDNIKTKFKRRLGTISTLSEKAFNLQGGQIPIDEEDEKFKERLNIIKENIKFIERLYKSEFRGEEEWVQYIKENYLKKDYIRDLLRHMQAYPPRSGNRLENATKSIIFKEYLKVLCIPYNYRKSVGDIHTYFASRMRNISDGLENKFDELYKNEYRRGK